MTPLDNDQQELLFDHAMGLTSGSDAAEADRLLATYPEAVHIYETLRNALAPLDSWRLSRARPFWLSGPSPI